MSKSPPSPRSVIAVLGLFFSVLFFLAGSTSRAAAQRIATVNVVGLDYAFQAPVTLPAGLTAFSFQNRGKVRHEVVLARLRPGITIDSVVRTDSAPARRRLIESVGLLVAEPGGTPLGRILVELTAGRTYILYCNLQDAPDKPRHITMGMVTSLRVKQRLAPP